MYTDNKMIVEHVVVTDCPETKTVSKQESDGNDYRYDILKGIRIPVRPDAHKSSIKNMEFKFSPNPNTPGIKKTALEVTRMIVKNEERLKAGELYAKVTLFMSPRSNKNGIVDSYAPYINDVELVESTEISRPLIDAALNVNKDPSF